MYNSIAFCLIGYCGYEQVDTCSKAHMKSLPQLMRVVAELQAQFIFMTVLIPWSQNDNSSWKYNVQQPKVFVRSTVEY